MKGYREVYKFLNLLGTVFGWVGSDVWAKIVQLEKYLGGEEKEHYQNCKAMIDYEVITKKGRLANLILIKRWSMI